MHIRGGMDNRANARLIGRIAEVYAIECYAGWSDPLGRYMSNNRPIPIGRVHTRASVAMIETISTMRVIRVQQKKRPKQRARDPCCNVNKIVGQV